MRKKSIVIGVCFIFCLMCFTGCGKNESGVEVQPTEQVTVSPEPTTELAATPIPTAEPTAEPTAIPTPTPALIEEPMTGFTSDEELRSYHESICEKYYDENGYTVLEHKEKYLEELQKEYKDVPVYRFNLLKSVSPDEHNTIEIYELAVLGHPVAYKDFRTDDSEYHNYRATGLDPNVELYDYSIVSRLLVDGKQEDVACYSFVNEISYESPIIIKKVEWTEAYKQETEDAYELFGINEDKSEDAVIVLTFRRPIVLDDYSYELCNDWCFLNGSTIPFLTEDYYVLCEGDSRFIYNDSFTTPYDGKFLLYDINAYRSEETSFDLVEEKTYKKDGNNVCWELFEAVSGTQILKKIYLEDLYEKYGKYSRSDYYIRENDHLILFKSDSESDDYGSSFWHDYSNPLSFIKTVSDPDPDGNYTITVNDYKPLKATKSDFEGKEAGDIVEIKGKKFKLLEFIESDGLDNNSYEEKFTDETDAVIVQVVDINEFSELITDYCSKIEGYNTFAFEIDHDGGEGYAVEDYDYWPESYVYVYERVKANKKLKVTDESIVRLCMYYNRYITGKQYFENDRDDPDLCNVSFRSYIPFHVYEKYDEETGKGTGTVDILYEIYKP